MKVRIKIPGLTNLLVLFISFVGTNFCAKYDHAVENIILPGSMILMLIGVLDLCYGWFTHKPVFTDDRELRTFEKLNLLVIVVIIFGIGVLALV